MKSLHIVCPHCFKTNRVPEVKMADSPKCGHCRKLLFTGTVVDVGYDGFQKQVSRNHIPVVIDFWASWCGPCKLMGPAFAAAALELEPKVRFIKLSTEAEPILARQWNIRSIPTIVLVMGGSERARQSGVMDAAAIVSWVKKGLE
ncbi:MAG: thioredoxin TrxC [Desulfobulbaceae bacterium]|nr:thioredoxin TrxC [Desulfobulbaceae bacterium]